MPKSIRCPACDRALALPAVPGPMVCDGCHHPFDATGLRHAPAPLPRRLLGWLLLAVAAYVLVVRAVPLVELARQAPPGGKRDDAVVFSAFMLAQLLLKPVVPFGLGLYLIRGRIVGVPGKVIRIAPRSS